MESGKNKMTFWQLLKRYKVEIPIIQRDYAQGREDDKTENVRNLFLVELTGAIKGEKKPIELDFVYGDLKKDGVFKPLGGQQRLTTLFLLHWYIAFSAGKLSEDVQKKLSKFSYETRASSREFCQALVKTGLPDDAKE